VSDHQTHSPYPAYVGVDLGQSRDYTAIAVVQQTAKAPNRYDLTYLHRWRPRRYQEVPPVVRAVVNPLRKHVTVWHGGSRLDIEQAVVDVIVDRTGVGRPVGDLMSETDLGGARLQLATITSGDTVSQDRTGPGRFQKEISCPALPWRSRTGSCGSPRGCRWRRRSSPS